MRSRVLFAGVMMAFAINSVIQDYHMIIGVLKLIQSYHVVQSLVIVKTCSYIYCGSDTWAVMNGTHVYHVPRKIIKYLLFVIYSTSFLRCEFIFVERQSP